VEAAVRNAKEFGYRLLAVIGRKVAPVSRACQPWAAAAASTMMITAIWRIAIDLLGAYRMTFEFPFRFGWVVREMALQHFLPQAFVFVAGLMIRIAAARGQRVPLVFSAAALISTLYGSIGRNDFGHELSHAIAGDCTGYRAYVLGPGLLAFGASIIVVLGALVGRLPRPPAEWEAEIGGRFRATCSRACERIHALFLSLAKPAAWSLVLLPTFLFVMEATDSFVFTPYTGWHRFTLLAMKEWVQLGSSLFLIILGLSARMWIASGWKFTRLLPGFGIFGAAAKIFWAEDSVSPYHLTASYVMLAAAVILLLAALPPHPASSERTATP
jgi:hypothetical protein